ncbi:MULTISPECIES: hypothetical protein [Gammaproteobacteria]|uniref:hypothetical protein n=1 Tax=Gammaproteobacteria TaxID=1236 RepID=UPI001E540188|nr:MULTISPECIES: hypothetical protein [Gammaproteobacteria]MDP4944816.1 hypothetical protein [Alishewanella sp.]MDP5207959.1 hypothetical protein [Alishewanella sp. SMS9]MCC5451494.1 hypothetical protein [Rheinheimera sp. UJ51]MCF4008165.1 hypothetical protein [Rheinheimera sp. UJ63]MDP5036362.1 hypothetical protein [Alishewanella sp.]
MEKPFQIKLIIRRVSAAASIAWLKNAWGIFKQYPIVFVQMILLTLALSVLASLHEITLIIAVLASPFITAGFYRAVLGVQQQQKISIDWLFQPFKEPATRRILLVIAALNFLISIPLAQFRVDVFATMQLAQESPDGAAGYSWSLLLLLIATLITAMLFAYAVAIAYFLKEQRIFTILQASFIACWRNIPALVSFGLLSLLLIILTVPTFFLGLIVVMPVLHIAFFLSFNELFALQVKSQQDGVLEV